jgi:hypothetical protein
MPRSDAKDIGREGRVDAKTSRSVLHRGHTKHRTLATCGLHTSRPGAAVQEGADRRRQPRRQDEGKSGQWLAMSTCAGIWLTFRDGNGPLALLSHLSGAALIHAASR